MINRGSSFQDVPPCLRLSASAGRWGEAQNRRVFLNVGAAGFLGLSLPSLLRAAVEKSQARSLNLMALEGGPAHQDLWDMKRDAPDNIRGEFRPIATIAPSLFFCEHLPLLAKQAHHLALIRSVHHTIGDHNAGYYFAMMGRDPSAGGRLMVAPAPDNFPPIASVVARLRPSGRPPPDLVQVPDLTSNNGFLLPGQHAGFLGAAFDPFVVGDPSLPNYKVPGLELPNNLSTERIAGRRHLLDAIGDVAHVDRLDAYYPKAFTLIAGPEARRAFDLTREPASTRERDGLDPDNPRTREARKFNGLPHLGQILLLARRLIEAGVRVVTVCTGARFDQSWDTHCDHLPFLKESILTMFDRGFTALLEDLQRLGLLDSTLVVALSEFGRTPRVGQITDDAGADKAGRDHWPHCYTVLMAGGAIFGASDRFAAPRSTMLSPHQISPPPSTRRWESTPSS